MMTPTYGYPQEGRVQTNVTPIKPNKNEFMWNEM
jgi:hypothetical protein